MTQRLRLIFWYITAFGALGALPYLGVVLGDKGLSDSEIALFASAFPLAALFAAPAWSWVADRTGRASAVLTLTTIGSTLGMAVVVAARAPWLIFVALLVHTVARSPQSPIVDSLTMRTMADDGRGYGRIRLWGSVAFLLVAFSGGWLREWWGVAPLVLGSCLLLTTIVASRLLPHEAAPVRRPQLRELVDVFARGNSAFLTLACICHGVGLAFYNVFFSRHIESLGLPSSLIGVAVVVAVGTEVGVMAVSPALLARFRPSHLLVLAFLGTVPRWLGTAHTSDPALLVALQALHGLSFGLFWVAAVPSFARHASPAVARSAQAVLTASAFGVGPLIATPIAWLLLVDRAPAVLFDVGAAGSLLGALVLLPVALRAPTVPALPLAGAQ